MRKITNRCDVISRTPVYQPSLFTTITLREDVHRSNFFGFLSVIKVLYSFPMSGKQIIMSVSKTEVKNEK